MNYLILSLGVALTATACSSRQELSSTEDSLIVQSEYVLPDEEDSTNVAEGDYSEIHQTLSALLSDYERRKDSYYHLDVNSKGKDFTTTETWSFDSAYTLVYCFQKWSNGDTTGLAHHFFRRQQLYAIHDENSFDNVTLVKLFSPDAGGVTVSKKENATDSLIAPLSRETLKGTQDDLIRRLSEVASLLSENVKSVTRNGRPTLDVIIPVGENSTEDERITLQIDEPLLQRLTGKSR